MRPGLDTGALTLHTVSGSAAFGGLRLACHLAAIKEILTRAFLVLQNSGTRVFTHETGACPAGGRGRVARRGGLASASRPHMREERVARVGFACNATRPYGSGTAISTSSEGFNRDALILSRGSNLVRWRVSPMSSV